MARHANQAWNLPEGEPTGNGGSTHTWESIHAALLMDIRDHLKAIRAVLECQNTVRIPVILDGIRRNTAKPRAPKKAA